MGKTVREILLEYSSENTPRKGKERREETGTGRAGAPEQVRSEEAAMKPVKEIKWMRRG